MFEQTPTYLEEQSQEPAWNPWLTPALLIPPSAELEQFFRRMRFVRQPSKDSSFNARILRLPFEL